MDVGGSTLQLFDPSEIASAYATLMGEVCSLDYAGFRTGVAALGPPSRAIEATLADVATVACSGLAGSRTGFLEVRAIGAAPASSDLSSLSTRCAQAVGVWLSSLGRLLTKPYRKRLSRYRTCIAWSAGVL